MQSLKWNMPIYDQNSRDQINGLVATNFRGHFRGKLIEQEAPSHSEHRPNKWQADEDEERWAITEGSAYQSEAVQVSLSAHREKHTPELWRFSRSPRLSGL